jgi:hypothetical protein
MVMLPMLLIATSIKPIEALVTIIDRNLTITNSILSNNSTYIIIFSILILCIYCFKFFYMCGGVLKIDTLIMMFVVFKLWLAVVAYCYGLDITKNLLSMLFILVFATYLKINHYKYDSSNLLYTNAVIFFLIIFLSLNLYELIFNYDGVVWKGRFFGLTNHPNYLGGYLSIISPFLLSGIINRKNVNNTKLLLFLSAYTLLFVFIIMSGSRSSFFSFLIGNFYVVLRSYKIKELFLKSIFGILFLSILLPFFISMGSVADREEFEFNRISSTLNTRSYVIEDLTNVYLDNIIVGNPKVTESTSNSYLSALARGGSIAGIILSTMLLYYLYILFFLDKYQHIILDLGGNVIPFIASSIIFLLYSIFEGVLIENFSCGQVLFVANLFYTTSFFNVIRLKIKGIYQREYV